MQSYKFMQLDGCVFALILVELALNLTACTSNPSKPTGMSEITQTETAASNMGTVSTGVEYPDTGLPSPQANRFDPGTPGPLEKAAIERTAPGASPRKVIEKYFNALPIAQDDMSRVRANVLFIDTGSYQPLFPKKLFYVLRFPQWPVSIAPPAGLASNNLMVFTQDKPLHAISNSHQLQEYFQLNAHTQGTADDAANTLKTWLSLFAELEQDGMFQFNAPVIESSTNSAAGGFEVHGHIDVAPKNGDMGSITGKVIVDANGKLQSATARPALQSGMRPICQATKLLDADPIVRKMAERDLLVMGRSARNYLIIQRSKAAPELRARIDQIWQQILDEGR
jgi:hypothetical protein